MRHPGHGNAEFGLGLREQCPDQSNQLKLALQRGVHHEQPKIRRYQFIATAACMKFPAERAKFFNQRPFDEVVDIFSVGAEGIDPSRIGFGARGDFVEGCQSLLDFSGGEDADGFECFGPGSVHGNFVRQQAAIEREGTLERVETRVRCAFKAPAP